MYQRVAISRPPNETVWEATRIRQDTRRKTAGWRLGRESAPWLRAMSLKCQERITRWIAGVRRKEKFLAIDAVRHDHIKTRPRCKPVVPSLGLFEFHVRPFSWIDQDAALKIEQYRIALGQNFEVLPVLKVCPCGSIC
jgi:hypothetical protein